MVRKRAAFLALLFVLPLHLAAPGLSLSRLAVLPVPVLMLLMTMLWPQLAPVQNRVAKRADVAGNPTSVFSCDCDPEIPAKTRAEFLLPTVRLLLP